MRSARGDVAQRHSPGPGKNFWVSNADRSLGLPRCAVRVSTPEFLPPRLLHTVHSLRSAMSALVEGRRRHLAAALRLQKTV